MLFWLPSPVFTAPGANDSIDAQLRPLSGIAWICSLVTAAPISAVRVSIVIDRAVTCTSLVTPPTFSVMSSARAWPTSSRTSSYTAVWNESFETVTTYVPLGRPNRR